MTRPLLRISAICAIGAALLSAGWTWSAAKPAKARLVASACMDEAYAYFDAATGQELGVSDDAWNDDLDSAGKALIRCLDSTLGLSDPEQDRDSLRDQPVVRISWNRFSRG
jgi:hypothetical protein